MKPCTDCGGDAARGWTDGEAHGRCAACEVARDLNGLRFGSPPRPHPKRHGECACGCGRSGMIVAHGLTNHCYMRLYRAGSLERWKEGRRV